MKHLQEHILVIENAIPDGLCNDILEEYKNDPLWSDAPITIGVDKSIRNCEVLNISYPQIINQKANRLRLDAALYEQTAFCANKYIEKNKIAGFKQDSGYDLLRYNVGSFYAPHTDDHINVKRTVSCSFALNDDYEGGEFSFFKGKLKYNLKKGDALMFPSNFVYPHEVMLVKKGTRYSIVTWLS